MRVVTNTGNFENKNWVSHSPVIILNNATSTKIALNIANKPNTTAQITDK